MEKSNNTAQTLNFEQLAELRDKTQRVSQFLETRLKAYLETLRPLLAPRRLLGKHVGAKEDVPGADKAVAQLQEHYKKVCRTPFALPPDWHETYLTHLDARLEIYPWEYTYEAKGEGETKTITITSPVRWMLIYGAGYTLTQIRQTLTERAERRQDEIRQFVVNALAMHVLLQTWPGIGRLLTDLRYEVRTDYSPDLGELPLVTISACLSSFRPSDGLLIKATRLSGIPAFIELIDLDSVGALQDPLKLRIAPMLK